MMLSLTQWLLSSSSYEQEHEIFGIAVIQAGVALEETVCPFHISASQMTKSSWPYQTIEFTHACI